MAETHLAGTHRQAEVGQLLKPGAENSFGISHVGGRDPARRTAPAAARVLGRRKLSWYLDTGAPTLSAGVLSGVLTALPLCRLILTV